MQTKKYFTRSFHYKIRPTEAQKKMLDRWFEDYIWFYNLGVRWEKETKTPLDKEAKAKFMEVVKRDKEFQRYGECPKGIYDCAWKRLFHNFKIFHGSCEKQAMNKLTFILKDLDYPIEMKNGKIIQQGIGEFSFAYHRPLPSNSKMNDLIFSRTSLGKYYISVLVSYVRTVTVKQPLKVIGFDYSLDHFLISSNCKKLDFVHFHNEANKEKVSRLEMQLAREKKNSRNYLKHRKQLLKMFEHEANQRRDYLEKLSSLVVKHYDVVVLESLDIKEMSIRHGRKTNDTAFYYFAYRLEEKMNQAGKRLIKVDRMFPSSQLCSNCGYRNRALKDLSIRTWVCPKCGIKHDRDFNAAINLKKEGIRLLNSGF